MLKVGEVARRTGLTVRTLHHYDEIGLLRPGGRTAAGHRLYGRRELERLQQIRSLRQLGFSLEETGACLEDPSRSLPATLAEHRVRLDERLEALRRLRERLLRLERRARSGEATTDDLLRTIEETTMIEKYYSEEQLETLAARREEVGEERIRAVQDRWASLTERVNAAIDAGLEPTNESVAALARDWRDLTRETVRGFAGGDAGIRASLGRMWREEPRMGSAWGMGPDVREYMRKAVACLPENGEDA